MSNLKIGRGVRLTNPPTNPETVPEYLVNLIWDLENILNNPLDQKATFCDYALTETGNLPTTFTKLDFDGATLINKTGDLFEPSTSRILFTEKGSYGQATISMEVNTSTGSNHWIDLQVRGYDVEDSLLFSKRVVTANLVKNNSSDMFHETVEFYFGEGAAYFEIWVKGSSAMSYANPAITVVKF